MTAWGVQVRLGLMYGFLHRLAYFEVKNQVYTQQQLTGVATKHYVNQVRTIDIDQCTTVLWDH